jgi:hypothetical protein
VQRFETEQQHVEDQLDMEDSTVAQSAGQYRNQIDSEDETRSRLEPSDGEQPSDIPCSNADRQIMWVQNPLYKAEFGYSPLYCDQV